jgi:outer membrane protein TolC
MDRLVLALKSLEQNVMIEVDDAIKLAKASYERIKATREASAYAQEALAAEQKKLESGKSTSFQVLELQKNLTDARNEEIRALTEYNRNLAQLSLFEASTLERLGINMEVK